MMTSVAFFEINLVVNVNTFSFLLSCIYLFDDIWKTTTEIKYQGKIQWANIGHLILKN